MCNNLSNTCGEFHYTKCIEHEGNVGKYSEFTSQCYNQKDINEDIYRQLNKIQDYDIDIEVEQPSCISFSSNKIKQSEFFTKILSEICSIKKDKVDNSSIDISSLNLDNITDPCGQPISDFNSLLQYIIDNISNNNTNNTN